MSFELGIVTSEAGESGACPADCDIASDEGEEKSGQRSARATQRITALGEMTRGIAHDFRNVLAIIESGLRLAEASLETPDKALSYLAAAHEGVGRGLRLASRLLAFAKPQKLDLHPENANDLIRELALFLKYGAGPGIRVRFDLAKEIPICLIEPSQFNAAILNLVVNARDAMPDGGEIRISTRPWCFDSGSSRENACLLVRVADNGEGMSAETVARIFDPFFTTKGRTGTGLGVPQVQAFMQSVGGQVRVMSRLGEGTTFELLFPAASNPGQTVDGLWLQLDRWTNEGGAPESVAAHPAWDEAGGGRARRPRKDLQ
ncbi:MAG TPA: ATP-binding protein [Allosphingosinicella sp.]